MIVAIGAVAIMALGLVGTLVPILPGLGVIWVAALGAWLIAGFGTTAWVSMAVLSVLLVVGVVAKVVLPARTSRDGGMPRASLAAALVGAIIGFFVIPLVGFLVGGVGALWVAETARLGDRDAAWRSTREMVRSYGIGVAVEVGAAATMIVAFVATVVVA